MSDSQINDLINPTRLRLGTKRAFTCDVQEILGEMSESYRESCEREIRNLIGNAVPKNFSWEDLMKFVPNGEQIIEVSLVYKSRRKHMPDGVILLLSNDEMVRLSLF